mmetsp:Transcript_51004/g.168922  ORF Transcript_51004/g.168922 Transcript_51004/m.168922 type:complete len:283 (-) Transcript_51004:380-1228(-)
MKRGNIDQRWSVPGGLSGLGGTGAKLSRRDLFSCRRLAVECIVFGALVLWFGLLCFFIAERYDRCAANSAATPASGTFVNIRAWVGQLYWQEAEQPRAGIGIEVGVSHAKPSDATWHIEPQDDSGWFCLRHVPTLRLLEAVPLSASAGGASLRLVRYGCDDAAQRFRYQGKSLYSQAAASYINMRELRLLRAHGDPPGGDLAPLRRETRATRVLLEESSSQLLHASLEKRLLALLPRLERGAAPVLAEHEGAGGAAVGGDAAGAAHGGAAPQSGVPAGGRKP